jgi:accessory gene regulator protein AgrB
MFWNHMHHARNTKNVYLMSLEMFTFGKWKTICLTERIMSMPAFHVFGTISCIPYIPKNLGQAFL